MRYRMWVNAFRMAFEGNGGKVVADVPYPFPNIPDFTPFMQRIKDVKPDGLYVFVVCASGSVLVYRNELYTRFSPKPLIVSGAGTPMGVDAVTAAAHRR